MDADRMPLARYLKKDVRYFIAVQTVTNIDLLRKLIAEQYSIIFDNCQVVLLTGSAVIVY